MRKFLAVAFALCFVSSCGKKEDPPAAPPAPPADPVWVKLKVVIERNCASCHTGQAFISSGLKFKASKAKIRVGNNSMPPPPAALSAGDKQAILEYLK